MLRLHALRAALTDRWQSVLSVEEVSAKSIAALLPSCDAGLAAL